MSYRYCNKCNSFNEGGHECGPYLSSDAEKAVADSIVYGEGYLKLSWDGKHVKTEYMPVNKKTRFRYRAIFKKKWWQWWK